MPRLTGRAFALTAICTVGVSSCGRLTSPTVTTTSASCPSAHSQASAGTPSLARTERTATVTSPQTVQASEADNGRVVSITVGDTLSITLGAQWQRPQIRPIGGDPGPVTVPLSQSSPTTPLSEATFTAVSAGQALITAQPTSVGPTSSATACAPFELTIHVRPRAGMQAPLSIGPT